RRAYDRERDRIWSGASPTLGRTKQCCLPSNRAVHLWRSDIIDRARCPPMRRESVASPRAGCSVPPGWRVAIPEAYPVRRVRLEMFAEDPAWHLRSLCLGQDKSHARSPPKQPASSQSPALSENLLHWLGQAALRIRISWKFYVQRLAVIYFYWFFSRDLAFVPAFENVA